MQVGDLVKDRWGTIGIVMQMGNPLNPRWLVYWATGQQYKASPSTLEVVCR